MAPLLHANLYLTSPRHFDPVVVTERTGLAMDGGFELGRVRTQPNGRSSRPAKVSLWCHSSGEFVRTADMEGLLNQFLDRIEPAAQQLATVRAEFDLRAHITVNVQMGDGHTPDGTLAVRTLARLVALDIDLDLDLYP